MVKIWSLLFLLGVTSLALNVDGAERDRHISVVHSLPPRYPPAAALAGISGTTTLLVVVGSDGIIERIVPEISSGNAELDAAAVDTVSRWTFSPAVRDGQPIRAQVRIPVKFDMYGDDTSTLSAASALPVELRVPPVPVDAEGKLPRYVSDPLPMEIGNVEAIVTLLKAQGRPVKVAGMRQDVSFYYLDRAHYLTSWEVHKVGQEYAPAVVRRRLTTDGVHAFDVTAVLCEGKAAACASFIASLRASNLKQPALRLRDVSQSLGEDVPVPAR